MPDRTKLMLVWPVSGFLAAMAFGAGVISMAAFESGPALTSAARSPVGARTIDVELGDLFIAPEAIDVRPGPVTFAVTNTGATEHNFAIEGVSATAMIPPGGSETLAVPDLRAGTYTFVCEVAGHAGGGMTGTLTVGGGEAEDGAPDGAGTSDEMSAEEMALHDAEVTGSFPASTRGVGGRDLAPDLVDGVKVFELTADEIEWEVSPGEVRQAYAYNGMVPGPTIRAELGDRIRLVLHNELAEPTTIHSHGMTVPAGMDGVPVFSQDAVLPGESFTYEYVIRNTGSNMYHSHFNAQKQVPMGLLGALIVPDPRDRAVDEDVTMILNDGPLGFTMNGKSFPATAPIEVSRGDTFRIRYMNEGLQIHPMHLHGLVQTVVAKDGHVLPRPHAEDTVLVAPGERVDVIVEATEAGTWALHCHVLDHAEGPGGMFGMVSAVTVE